MAASYFLFFISCCASFAQDGAESEGVVSAAKESDALVAMRIAMR
jgi:hypothetical protein